MPWLSGKDGKVGMKDKEKEKGRSFFLTVRSLKMSSNVSICLRVSLRVVTMTMSFHPGVCSSQVPVKKKLFLSLNGKTRNV